MKSKLIILAGFALGTVAGFVYGKTVRKNAPSHVTTSYQSGVVTIHADVGNLAKQSFNEAKVSMIDTVSAYLQ